MQRFILLAAGLAALLLGAVYTGASQRWFTYPSFSKETIAFLCLSHIVLYVFLVRHLDQRPEDFVKLYLGSTVIRILFFGLFVFVIIRLDRNSGSGNALVFLLSYFLYTGLEVGMLYGAVKNRKPPETGQKGG